MSKPKVQHSSGRTLFFVVCGFIGLGLLLTFLMQGSDIVLFNPKGRNASEQLRLLLLSAGILFAVALPTLACIYLFAWKYRERSGDIPPTYSRAHRLGDKRGAMFTYGIWVLPVLVFIGLAFLNWSSTYRLEPQKALAAEDKTQVIQVVAMRWKWLFIYPGQRIASVNYVQLPKDIPVRFELSADDAPMSSFWIPHLSGQLYAMTGHINLLNMVADTPGDYPGSSAEINGAGFADMKFNAKVTTQEDFDTWVKDVRQSSLVLDKTSYSDLLKPDTDRPVTFYSDVPDNFFDTVVQKYMGNHKSQSGNEGH